MAKKTNKYTTELRNILRMIDDGMLGSDSIYLVEERLDEYLQQKKINKVEFELLKRATGDKK